MSKTSININNVIVMDIENEDMVEYTLKKGNRRICKGMKIIDAKINEIGAHKFLQLAEQQIFDDFAKTKYIPLEATSKCMQFMVASLLDTYDDITAITFEELYTHGFKDYDIEALYKEIERLDIETCFEHEEELFVLLPGLLTCFNFLSKDEIIHDQKKYIDTIQK